MIHQQILRGSDRQFKQNLGEKIKNYSQTFLKLVP